MNRTRGLSRVRRATASAPVRRTSALVAGILVCTAMASLFAGPAAAAGAGTATARTADVEIAPSATAYPPLASVLATLDLTATTPLQTAPVAPGSSTDTTALAVTAAAASVSTGAVSSTATRAVDSTSGQSTVASTGIALLGTTVLRTGVISSSATCPVAGATTATTSAADVVSGTTTLDPTAGGSANVVVTVPGLLGATVNVAVSAPHANPAGTATATGLLVTLTLHGTLGVAAVSIPLGTVTFAASSCASPSAAVPTATALSPASGPTAGGQTVTVTGTGFTPGATVSFGGTPATNVTVQSATSLTATAPAHAAGQVGVVVTTAGGSSAAQTYTYQAPVATTITPAGGPTLGGQSVTITGSGLAADSAVTVGGLPATGVVVDNAGTQITATTPAHPAGVVDVDITAGGVAEASLPGAYTYLPPAVPPVAVGISPLSGPTAGGQTVTVTGTGFTPTATVTVGGLAATGVVVAPDGTSLTAVTPAHAAGPAAVTVTTAGGSSTPLLPYTYVAAPTVLAVLPPAGPVTGGQTVTVTGTGFTSASTVTVGGAAATGVVVAPDGTSLTAVTPAHTAGLVDVAVTTAGGTSLLPAAYTYVPAAVPPVAVGISPLSGPTAGGQTVTVTGTGFTPTATVTVGGLAATGVVVAPDGTSLTAVTPAHAAGPAAVTVTTTGGSSTPLLPYTYLPVPTAVSADPAAGPVTGGQTVTVAGTGFTPDATVTFGGVLATGVLVTSSTSLTAVTPPHAAGPVGIVVSTAGGSSSPAAYTYVTAPTAASVDPAAGPVAGGQTVTVAGTGFTPDATVTFGGVAATGVVVAPDGTSLTAVTPAHVAGLVDIVVSTAGGSSGLFLFYTYTPAPTATSVDPVAGPVAGGQTVTVAGTGFTPGTTVSFGGVAATGVAVAPDGTSLTALTPAHAAGPVVVTVTTAGGSSTLLVPYTYLAVPIAVLVDPLAGPVAGGQTVTVVGSGFTPGATVSFGGVAATGVVVAPDGTSLTAVTPAHPAGPVGVVVTTGGGASLPTAYTYLPVPIAALVAPLAGPTSGGQAVTVTGTGFAPGSTVTFGGTPATGVDVTSDTTLTAVTPAHAAGLVDVVVTTPGGTSTPAPYTYVPAPTAASVDPTSGPTTGTQVVTVTGTGFAPGATVTFGGTPATGVVVTSGTSLTAVTPAHAAGPVGVVVTTPGGATSPVPYTYVPAPTAVSVDPDAGPVAGGQTVTITGTGFTPDATVTFGGVAATGVVVAPDGTSLTAVTPAHVAGLVDVVVTTAGGTSGLFLFYAYTPAPFLTGLSPDTGPATGGQTVTFTGGGFAPDATVTFGGVAATAVTVAPDGTSLTAVTPPHVAGVVDARVADAGGSSLPRAYTYLPAPTATLVDPDTGPVAGGQPVTVTGSGFTSGATVTFGGTPATSVVVTSDTSLTAVTPAHAAGEVDVVVTTAGGVSSAAAYTYVTPMAAPTVTALDPTSGPAAGGQTVTVTGTGFTPQTTVNVDGVPATDVTVRSSTSLTAVTPAHQAGPAGVVATTVDGSSAPVTYTYEAPSVIAVSPHTGPARGGQHVTITGRGFAPHSAVSIGGRPATDVVVNAAGTGITLVTPAGTAGQRATVEIFDANGPETSVPAGYAYLPPPTVMGMSPASGPAGGGQQVIITGSGFVGGGTAVMFGPRAATDVMVISDDTLSVRTPAGRGTVHIVLTDADGTATSDGVYTYVLGETFTSTTGGTDPTGAGGDLPFTGLDVLELVCVGGVLLAAGAGSAVVGSRRHRRR